jgi:hypothetical protein
MTSFARLTTAALQALALSVLAPSSQAAPGAHGPNGEHLDAPVGPAAGSTDTPRFEARTETFEMVGRLQGGELSIFINRFETNEPVLDATVELETGDLKAKAPFHRDLGDYSVDDKAFLEALSKPGRHSLVIMVVAGADSDLLDATLVVTPTTVAAAGAHEHAWWESRFALLGGLGLGVALLVGWALLRSRRPAASLPEATR